MGSLALTDFGQTDLCMFIIIYPVFCQFCVEIQIDYFVSISDVDKRFQDRTLTQL